MSPPRTATRFSLIESDSEAQLASLAEAVDAGLSREHKAIPCHFLYDEEGSRLFEEICELPEYYLTRAESSILREHANAVAGVFDGPITLAELGSGSSNKTRLLIEACLRAHGRLRYLPVDISAEILEESARALLDDYEALEVRAIASEYREGLRHVHAERGRPKLIAWLGSSVGNLTRAEASGFVRSVRGAMVDPDRMLLGIDLRKAPEVLEAAYDDAAQTTAQFSLNLLARINRELEADFDLDAFRHRAQYHRSDGRVEICLVSQREQQVRIKALERQVAFRSGEAIHVENSFKYSTPEIEALAASAGLRLARQWLDDAGQYSLNLLAPA